MGANETIQLDAETKVSERPTDHKDELRLWLRLLTCTTLIEGVIRLRLRERFELTLPRFDLMAQLEKLPEGDGMTLGDVSRRMMVSNGNVTGLVERLVRDGLIERIHNPADRRATAVRLTGTGRAAFADMAREHEGWVADAFSELSPGEVRALMRLLGKLKSSALASAA